MSEYKDVSMSDQILCYICMLYIIYIHIFLSNMIMIYLTFMYYELQYWYVHLI